MKLFKMALLALFVTAATACSKGEDQNAQEKAEAATQQAVPAAHEQKGGYNPDADADSDC